MAALRGTSAAPRLAIARVCIFCQHNSSSQGIARFSSRLQRRPFSHTTASILLQHHKSAAAISILDRAPAPFNGQNRALRHFHTFPGRFQQQLQQQQQRQRPSQTAPPQTSSNRAPPPKPVTPEKPKRPHVKAYDGELAPAPLTRPLGLPHPPQPGENTGVDERPWHERRKGYFSFERHAQRRREIIREVGGKSYFHDLSNVGKIHKGKSILSPTTPFRKDVALWFPNLRGRTLLRGRGRGDTVDTTPVLRGRVSIVCISSVRFGEDQANTFIGDKEGENPEVGRYLQTLASKDTVQKVEINVQQNYLKWLLVRFYFRKIRKRLQESQWGRYFLIRHGLSEEIKDAIGIWNLKVGYVYLLDPTCKIRWVGNGDAREDEKRSFLTCLKRLVDEAQGLARPKITRQDARPTSKATTPDNQAVAVGAI